MSIQLVEKMLGLVDEKFEKESNISLLTNDFFDFEGASTVKIYKTTTAPLVDYDRKGVKGLASRYGEVGTLEATTETFQLSQDKSFTYVLDLMDIEESALVLEATKALGRQVTYEVVPYFEKYVLGKMIEGAGIKPTAVKLDETNVYNKIIEANELMDEAMVPNERYLVVTPKIFTFIKRNKDFMMNTDISQEMKIKGVVAEVDGLNVIKVPSNKLPENFGFLIASPISTVAPIKLAQYNVHNSPPGVSGQLTEGRFYFDAFVLENKKEGLAYQEVIPGA